MKIKTKINHHIFAWQCFVRLYWASIRRRLGLGGEDLASKAQILSYYEVDSFWRWLLDLTFCLCCCLPCCQFLHWRWRCYSRMCWEACWLRAGWPGFQRQNGGRILKLYHIFWYYMFYTISYILIQIVRQDLKDTLMVRRYFYKAISRWQDNCAMSLMQV